MLKGLGIGRVVHYVIADGDLAGNGSIGEHKAAIVVENWPGLGREDGYANLMVILDGDNDQDGNHLVWVTSRTYSEDKTPRTWHWPETV